MNILNVNRLNVLVKRHKVTKWIFFKSHIYMLPGENHFRFKDTHRLKIKGKDSRCKWKQKES